MNRISFDSCTVVRRDGESVLDALLRAGANPPFSCRNGVCLGCMQRAISGEPGADSQRALREELRQLGYFLPCRSRNTGDLEVGPVNTADLFVRGVLAERELLADGIWRIVVEPFRTLSYRAGQFVIVRRADGLVRPYSIVNPSDGLSSIELHVRHIPDGEMSTWLCTRADIGDELELQGPNGQSHYVSGSRDQDLLFVVTGTGAGAAVGIVRDALAHDHRGRIRLLHGSHTASGLYLDGTFRAIAARHACFSYTGCVSGPDAARGFTAGRADDVAERETASLRGWRVYAIGNEKMVQRVARWAAGAGASPAEIHTDPFVSSAPVPEQARQELAHGSTGGQPDDRFEADPEMWAALGEGQLLEEILRDFYTRVFDDALLAPYFAGVTRDRLVGQVFSYMRDNFSGQRLYFGMRPRTAHHWMVIPDAIFDHREALMESCLRDHGLAEHLILRWRRFEERFRGDIVKSVPWKLVVNGTEMPLDGFGEEELLAGTVCDGCERAVEPGERVRYHLRLGLTYCTSWQDR